MSGSNISARLDSKILAQLEKLAKATKRSKSFLAADAIQKYVEEQSWQTNAIQEGIKEADKGRFATDKEVNYFFSKSMAEL